MMRCIPFGDRAMILRWNDGISEETNAKVIQAMHAIEKASLPGLMEMVPAYNELMIVFDARTTDFKTLQSAINSMDFSCDGITEEGREWHVPVCYGGDYGPDLPIVAAHCDIAEAELIARHSAEKYRVYMLGFMPGFCYLGGLPAALSCPRKERPSLKIAAGSVGIAGQQTGVYPLESPGGWQIIGRTPLPFFNPTRFWIEAGDYIQFVPVDTREFEHLQLQVAADTFDIHNFLHA